MRRPLLILVLAAGCSERLPAPEEIASSCRFEARGPSEPVVTDVDVHCPAGATGYDVAAGASGEGYLLLSDRDHALHLATIHPDGTGGVEDDPIDVTDWTVSLARDPDGTPHLVTAHVPGIGLAYYGRGADGDFAAEAVAPDAPGLAPAGFAAGASASHLLALAEPSRLELATREGGAWSRRTIVDDAAGGAVGIGEDGRAEIAYWIWLPDASGRELRLVGDAASPSRLLLSYPGNVDTAAKLEVAGGATALNLPDAIHVLAFAETGVSDFAVPSTGTAFASDCPANPTEPTWDFACDDGAICHERGDLAMPAWSPFALATTDGGVRWLFVLTRHIDRDLRQSTHCEDAGCQCWFESVADRSGSALVVSAIPAGGGAPVSVYQLPIGNVPSVELDADARGRFVHLALFGAQPDAAVPTRYLVLDTDGLAIP